MDTLGVRLRLIRADLSQQAIAEKLGLPQTTWSNYEKDKNKPDFALLDKICLAFHVNAEWLLFGRGQMRLDTQALHTDLGMVLVPVVEAVLSAGYGSFETKVENESIYAFRSDFLCRKGSPPEMVLMRVDGDSMAPRICHGDVVLIDQSQTALRPGQIYAVGVEGMVFLKMVSAIPGKVILRSLNDAYPPLEIDTRKNMQESVRIAGRCVWSCRDL